jgi:UDP-N-acetylmuramoyl-tripeptide--D-alanyl-D-alanine ligase
MTALWTAAEIAAATGGHASGDFAINGVAFDSREVGAGDLFVAMMGDNMDGHRFVDGAIGQGAAGALVSQQVDHPHIRVVDTMAALNALAVASRARTAAKVFGVTGSVGKTGTKEALAAALARRPGARVHRSIKSYNNHTGVPLSLARMPRETDFGVFEMGMNHAGEIAALTKIVRPHIALITTIAPAHIEHFADGLAGIASAKGEIFEGLEPDGIAIIPRDAPEYERLAASASEHVARIISFGGSDTADVYVRDAVPTSNGTHMTAILPDQELSLTVGQAGVHWVSNALAVIAAVWAAGDDVALAGLALAELEQLSGRGARFTVKTGKGEALIIDESYNANVASMVATLAVLRETEAERRIAVLGEMRELGAESARLHGDLAEPVRAANVDYVILVGNGMAPLAATLGATANVAHVRDTAQALALLKAELAAGDAVLVKGSNGVGLSALVSALREG